MSWRKWFVDAYFSVASVGLIIVSCLLIGKFVGVPEIFSNNQLTGIVILLDVACLLLPFWDKVRKDVK